MAMSSGAPRASAVKVAVDAWNIAGKVSLGLGMACGAAALVAWQVPRGRAWLQDLFAQFQASPEYPLARSLVQYAVIVFVATVFEASPPPSAPAARPPHGRGRGAQPASRSQKLTGVRVLSFVYLGIFGMSIASWLQKGAKLLPSPEEARARVVRRPGRRCAPEISSSADLLGALRHKPLPRGAAPSRARDAALRPAGGGGAQSALRPSAAACAARRVLFALSGSGPRRRAARLPPRPPPRTRSRRRHLPACFRPS